MCYRTAFSLALCVVGLWIVVNNIPTLLECFMAAAGRIMRPQPEIADYWFWLFVPTPITLLKLGIGLYLLAGARALVVRLSPPNRPTCPSCEYDLSGLGTSGRCPECGIDLRHTFNGCAPSHDK